MKPRMMKWWVGALALTGIVATPEANANGKGNGGVAMVCRDMSGKIRSVEMLDLRRGRRELGLSFPGADGKGDRDFWTARAFDRLAIYPAAYAAISERFEGIASGGIPIVSLTEGDLFWTGDAEPGEADSGCRFEQVGVFQNETLYVNTPLLQAMKGVDIAAFYLHESIYAVAKAQTGAESSLESQYLVALLMADTSSEIKIATQIEKTLPGLRLGPDAGKWHWDWNISTRGALALISGSALRLTASVTQSSSWAAEDCVLNLSIFGASPPHSEGVVPMPPSETRIPLLRISSRENLWKGKSYSFDLPVMPSAIFAKQAYAKISFSGCQHVTSLALELFQDGRVRGRWTQHTPGGYHGYDRPAFALQKDEP